MLAACQAEPRHARPAVAPPAVALPAVADAAPPPGPVALGEQPCWYVRLLPDGTPILRFGALSSTNLHAVVLPGVTPENPVSDPYATFMDERVATGRRSLRCTVHSMEASGRVHADVAIFGWQDKSGDVWFDLGDLLVERGLATRR